MLLRRITDFLLQNRVQAMAVAFLFAFVPVIGSIGILIAAFITLRKGIVEGALVTLAATIPYMISFGLSPTSAGQMEVLGVILLGNLLIWAFSAGLRQFGSWNFILESAALAGVLLVSAVHLINPNIQNWWATELTTQFTKTTDAVSGKLNMDPSAQLMAKEAQLQVVNIVKQYATGFLAVSILLSALLQVVIARWWQAIIFNPGGLQKELYQIRFSYVAGAVYSICLLLVYLQMELALDVFPVLSAIFFFAGLSLIHWRISLTKANWLWLLLIYLGIGLLFPVSVILVSILALFDTGLDFRKRFKMMKR